MKVVIVGGVAGGATAAARIRRLDEQAEIVVFERSGYISYANCGLPYYIGGVIEDPEELTLQTPESFFRRFRIHMKVRHEVTAIHPEKKTVSVKDLETGAVFEEAYDKLLLSPGAKPVWPNLPGMDSDRLFTLRTVEDTLRIKAFVDRNKPRSAVMVGGGFIGLEVAENLRELGLEVTIGHWWKRHWPAAWTGTDRKTVKKQRRRPLLFFIRPASSAEVRTAPGQSRGPVSRPPGCRGSRWRRSASGRIRRPKPSAHPAGPGRRRRIPPP